MAAVELPEGCSEKWLVEFAARQPRLNAARGTKRLEFLLKDGNLVEAHVHDRVTPGELERSTVLTAAELAATAVAIPPE